MRLLSPTQSASSIDMHDREGGTSFEGQPTRRATGHRVVPSVPCDVDSLRSAGWRRARPIPTPEAWHCKQDGISSVKRIGISLVQWDHNVQELIHWYTDGVETVTGKHLPIAEIYNKPLPNPPTCT